jgi:hypothetical protein
MNQDHFAKQEARREPRRAVLRRVLPTRARITLSVYDSTTKPKHYRGVPGWTAAVVLPDAPSAYRLWAAVRRAISEETHARKHSSGDRDGSSGRRVGAAAPRL